MYNSMKSFSFFCFYRSVASLFKFGNGCIILLQVDRYREIWCREWRPIFRFQNYLSDWQMFWYSMNLLTRIIAIRATSKWGANTLLISNYFVYVRRLYYFVHLSGMYAILTINKYMEQLNLPYDGYPKSSIMLLRAKSIFIFSRHVKHFQSCLFFIRLSLKYETKWR